MAHPSTISPLRIGEVFLGEYQVLEAIGRGGFGCVYRAREEFTGREVALKIITICDQGSRVSRETFERGRQEAKILAEIEHPHIVNVYRAGQTGDGHIYIVMELLRGVSLAQRLRQGPMEVEEGLRIIEALADALQLVHSKNIAHRDIKPANIIIREDGVAKLVDFGIAKVAGGGGAHTAPNQIPGTGLYISPEQLYSLIGKGPRPPFELGDIYALGLVAFQMFQGTHPFLMLEPSANFANPQVVWKFHMKTPVPRLDQVIDGFPSAVALLVATALAKDPDDRLKSMSEFGAKARTARLHFLSRTSAAHYTPLVAERPRDQATIPEPVAAPETAALLPRSTKKQFHTGGATRYVDIPEATLERPSRSPERLPISSGPKRDDARASGADFANPGTPQAGSRTMTVPNAMRAPRRALPTGWTVSAGVLAGLTLVFGVLPFAQALLSRSGSPQPLGPGEIVIESVEPQPHETLAHETLPPRTRLVSPPVRAAATDKIRVEQATVVTEAPAPADPSARHEVPINIAPAASSPPIGQKAAAAPPQKKPASAQVPRSPFQVSPDEPAGTPAGKPAGKAKAKDWKAELSGDGWLE